MPKRRVSKLQLVRIQLRQQVQLCEKRCDGARETLYKCEAAHAQAVHDLETLEEVAQNADEVLARLEKYYPEEL